MNTEFLTKKYGPLPGWAYVGIVGVPVVYFIFKSKSGGATPAQSTGSVGSPMDQYSAGQLSYGSTGGGGSGSSGGGTPFDPSGLISAIQSGNEKLLESMSQQNTSFASNFNTALGALQQSVTALANKPALTAPTSYPGTSYSPPYAPPPVAPPTPQAYIPPSVPMYTAPPIIAPTPPVYIAPQGPSYLPVGSYQNLGNNAYRPAAPGPLMNYNYSDPRMAGTTVFNGQGQVWKGLVPA